MVDNRRIPHTPVDSSADCFVRDLTENIENIVPLCIGMVMLTVIDVWGQSSAEWWAEYRPVSWELCGVWLLSTSSQVHIHLIRLHVLIVAIIPLLYCSIKHTITMATDKRTDGSL